MFICPMRKYGREQPIIHMDDLSELLIDSKSDEKFNRLFRNLIKKNKYIIEKRGSSDYYIINDGKNSLGFDISLEKYDYIKNKNLAACDTLMERIKREFYILERLISLSLIHISEPTRPY